MSRDHQNAAISAAALLYGVIAILTVLLPTTADEFTIRNVVWGGAVVGFAAMMTYFLKEVVHREADAQEALGLSGYLREFARSLPVLTFPAVAILIGVGGLAVRISAASLIDSLFYSGLLLVCAAAFVSSYLVYQKVFAALLRALVWISICVLLLLIKKLI